MQRVYIKQLQCCESKSQRPPLKEYPVVVSFHNHSKDPPVNVLNKYNNRLVVRLPIIICRSTRTQLVQLFLSKNICCSKKFSYSKFTTKRYLCSLPFSLSRTLQSAVGCDGCRCIGNRWKVEKQERDLPRGSRQCSRNLQSWQWSCAKGPNRQ